MDSKAEFTA